MRKATEEGTTTSPRGTDSEAWRHECEARSILAISIPSARRARLALIERARGKDAREKLQQTINILLDRQIAAGRAALKQAKSLLCGKR